MNDTDTSSIIISSSGDMAIRNRNVLDTVNINASSASASLAAIGVGVTQLGSAVDFSIAGVSTARFMIPPKVSTSGRNSLQNVVSGALIYNTSTNKLQVYNGSAWQDCN
jgi:hypothetical protein